MLCKFNDSNQCGRCGFKASKVPLYRSCQTIEEMARERLQKMAANRIRVPVVPVGSLISRGLTAIGVSEERVKKLIGRECGCKARAARIDTASTVASRVVERAANAALSRMLPFEITENDVAALAQAIYDSPTTNEGLKDHWQSYAREAGNS